MWLRDEEKCVISRNMVFTEDVVFKDLKKKTVTEDVSVDPLHVQKDCI